MTTVLQTKVTGLNEIADAINGLCSDNVSRFKASIVADMWPENNPNCGAGEISASVHKPQFGVPSLILKIRTPNISSYEAPGKDEMSIFSQSREIGMTPEFIIIDESKWPTRIDFYAIDMSDLPIEIHELIIRHRSIGIHNPGQQEKIQNAIDQLVPKVYTSIDCALV